jgi:hypothetical protein
MRTFACRSTFLYVFTAGLFILGLVFIGNIPETALCLWLAPPCFTGYPFGVINLFRKETKLYQQRDDTETKATQG